MGQVGMARGKFKRSGESRNGMEQDGTMYGKLEWGEQFGKGWGKLEGGGAS